MPWQSLFCWCEEWRQYRMNYTLLPLCCIILTAPVIIQLLRKIPALLWYKCLRKKKNLYTIMDWNINKVNCAHTKEKKSCLTRVGILRSKIHLPFKKAGKGNFRLEKYLVICQGQYWYSKTTNQTEVVVQNGAFPSAFKVLLYNLPLGYG